MARNYRGGRRTRKARRLKGRPVPARGLGGRHGNQRVGRRL